MAIWHKGGKKMGTEIFLLLSERSSSVIHCPVEALLARLMAFSWLIYGFMEAGWWLRLISFMARRKVFTETPRSRRSTVSFRGARRVSEFFFNFFLLVFVKERRAARPWLAFSCSILFVGSVRARGGSKDFAILVAGNSPHTSFNIPLTGLAWRTFPGFRHSLMVNIANADEKTPINWKQGALLDMEFT